MARMIFVNLPSSDLGRTERFYSALGWTKNPHFSDETALCMMWSDAIYAMLLTHEKWRSFTSRTLPNAHNSCQVMSALNLDDRQTVDRLTDAASGAGGTADPNPLQDHGFMYSRSVADPDGHIWELFWMDPAAVPPQVQP